MADLIRHNKELLNQNRSKFQNTFGIPLTRFMHPLFGFDVVSFDSWLNVPDGVSTADHILATKGQEALTLVEVLLI